MITLLLHYGSIKNKITLCTTDYGEWEGLGFPFLNLKISPCQALQDSCINFYYLVLITRGSGCTYIQCYKVKVLPQGKKKGKSCTLGWESPVTVVNDITLDTMLLFIWDSSGQYGSAKYMACCITS